MKLQALKLSSRYTLSSLAFFAASTAQAVPLISVSTDDLSVSYSVETTTNSVTTTHSDSSAGSILGSDEEVAFTQFYIDSVEEESYVIDLRAAGYAGPSNTFNLDAEADDYYFGSPGAFPELDSVGALSALTTLTWEFSVIDEDVGFWAGIFNEEDPYPRSQAELVLFDSTLGTDVVNVSGGFGVTDEVTLEAGHEYILTAIAGDFYHDDENTYLSFRFDDDAIITNVPEPASLSILLLGIAGMIKLRKKS